MAIFKKTRNGSLIIKVTTDRKLNILSEEVTESDETIDYTPLVACLAEEFVRSQGKEN